MAKMDKTGMILAGGAIGLGFLLLPGFFQGRSEEDPDLVPDELSPADLERMGPDVPTKDKKKKVLIAKAAADETGEEIEGEIVSACRLI